MQLLYIITLSLSSFLLNSHIKILYTFIYFFFPDDNVDDIKKTYNNKEMQYVKETIKL